MSDQELLEMAARAAGFQLADELDSHIPSGGVWVVGPHGGDIVWTPLNDDGDALRLAVKLEIHIRFHGATILCECPCGTWLADEVDTTGDRRAATRRAIVRAAAEFGGAV